MTPILLKAHQQRSTLITFNLPCFGDSFQNIPSKLLRLSLTLCLFSFTMCNSQNVLGQTYTGSHSFNANGTPSSFNYVITYSSPAPSTSALVTVTYTAPATNTIGLNAQLHLGGGTFVGMAGSFPNYSFTVPNTRCCPLNSGFQFWMAYAGGLFQSSTPAMFPLPITLSNFSTKKHGDRGALLTWSTSSEINSNYFGIERSTDGTAWDHIGKLSAAGNSHTELTYSYVDADLPLGRTANKIFYYRLKLTDLDGSFQYSDIRGINLSTEFTNINVYPNPAKDLINVDLAGIDTQAGEVRVGIYDHKGAEILTKIITGSGIELIDLNHLSSAIYNITIKQGLETIHQSSIIKVD